MMLQTTAEIVAQESYHDTYYKLRLETETKLGAAIPGQFVMVRIPQEEEPLLRRPFSIHGILDGNRCGIELLFKRVGRGTDRLSRLGPGDQLDLVGPLGNGFNLSSLAACRSIFLVAGGIGIAPIRFLAQTLKGRLPDFGTVDIFLGAQTQADLLCREELESLGGGMYITTDDGSMGQKAMVTTPLGEAVSRQRPDRVFACGPPGLLGAVIDLSKDKNLPCEVSIETMMACGMGACLGCAIGTEDGDDRYRHVCVDGPVFDARRLAAASLWQV